MVQTWYVATARYEFIGNVTNPRVRVYAHTPSRGNSWRARSIGTYMESPQAGAGGAWGRISTRCNGLSVPFRPTMQAPSQKTMIVDLLVISCVALIFLALSWGWVRSINRGRPLSVTQRRMLRYGFLFVYGEGCLMAISAALRWSDAVLFPLIGGWVA